MKLKRLLLTSLIILLVLAISAILFFYLSPANGDIPSINSEIISTAQQTTVENTSTIKTDCASFLLPFTNTNIKTEIISDNCVVSARLLKPVGHFSISISKKVVPLNTLSSVIYRNNNSDIYTLSRLSFPSIIEVLKYTSADTVNYFFILNNPSKDAALDSHASSVNAADYQHISTSNTKTSSERLVTISFTYLANPNTISDDQIVTLLDSLIYE